MHRADRHLRAARHDPGAPGSSSSAPCGMSCSPSRPAEPIILTCAMRRDAHRRRRAGPAGRALRPTSPATTSAILKFVGILESVLQVHIFYLPVPRSAVPLVAEATGRLSRLGMRLPIDRGRVLLSRRFMYYDSSRAVSRLGLRPRPFPESVQAAYEWYMEQGLLKRRASRRVAAAS